ncbi:uncharacterized protein DS421_2g39580 [Arachis hypogaea]|nr:uncharacterized protein DS421_2g39580 [Arachis hypogaea]
MDDSCWKKGAERAGRQGSAARPVAHERQPDDIQSSRCDVVVLTRAGGHNEAWMKRRTVEEGGDRLDNHEGGVDGRAEGASAECNNKNSHGKDDEHNGGQNEVLGKTGQDTKACMESKLPVPNEANRYDEDVGELEDEAQANYAEASDNEDLTLEDQLIENKRTWELANESGAMLYDEEEDIMAILQQQNEEIALKKMLAKQKVKARRSRPKTYKKVCNNLLK